MVDTIISSSEYRGIGVQLWAIVGQLRLGRSTYGFEGRQSEECHDNQRHESEWRQGRTRNGKGEKERRRPEPSGQCSPVGNALVYSVDEGDAEQVEGDPTGERHPRTEAIIASGRRACGQREGRVSCPGTGGLYGELSSHAEGGDAGIHGEVAIAPVESR